MKKELSFTEIMQKYIHAGLKTDVTPFSTKRTKWDSIAPLEERIDKLLGIINRSERNAGNMIFFVMYDITSNKVRTQVVKYLEKKGCLRIQRSIFLADLPSSIFSQIKSDLAEVQAAYDNEDSIMVVPFSTDYLKSMKIIGKKIELDVILHNKTTLFF